MAEHKVHRLKTWPEQFAAIMAGVKPFEYRKNDRDFQPGDTALLEEWMPETAIYTGRVLERRITYVLRAGEFGVPDGYCVFGHAPASPPATAAESVTLREALQAYLNAQCRMLARWSEGDENVKRDLWRNLHACEDAARAALTAAGQATPPIGRHPDIADIKDIEAYRKYLAAGQGATPSEPAFEHPAARMIPPLLGLKGRRYFAEDSDGNWFYINHANTWQGCPPIAGRSAQGAPTAALLPLAYPDEMSPELADVLGRPNFWCSPIAHAFRAAGHKIPHKAEDEQAFVLHWLVKLVLKHGAAWPEHAAAGLKAVRAHHAAAADDGSNA